MLAFIYLNLFLAMPAYIYLNLLLAIWVNLYLWELKDFMEHAQCVSETLEGFLSIQTGVRIDCIIG